MRDFDAWYGSMAGWNGYDQRLGRCRLGAYPGGIHDPRGGGEEGGGGLRESLRSFYCDQVERVRGFVLRHPSHALVEVDVSDLASGPYLGGLFGIDPGRCWGMHNVNPARAVLDGEAGLDLGPFRDRAWEARFAQLVRFRERHGHCRVPELGGEGGEEGDDAAGLGRWVARQRFLAHADGRDDGDAESSAPLLPVDRWRRLDEIGFEWEQRGRRWTAMMERLEAVLAGGAADPDPSGGGGPDPPPPHSPDPVPTDVALAAATRRLRAKRLLLNPSNRDLRVWVRAQRDQHARRMRGLPSSLTDERIARLESIPGWRWVGRRGPVTGYDDDDPEGGGRGRAKPSASDWSRLLEEARKVDVAAKVIPNPSAADIMDWDDDNLADLWDMEDD